MNVTLIVISTFLIGIGLIAVFGNMLILAVVVKYNQSMANHFFHLIAVLALFDWLTGFGSFISGIDRIRIEVLEINFTKGQCLLTVTPMIYGFTAGQIILIFVCLDRLYATMKPLEYTLLTHNKFTKVGTFAAVIYTTISVGSMYIGVDLESKPPVCNGGASWHPYYKAYWVIFTTIAGLIIICGYLGIIASLWCLKGRSDSLSQEQRNTQTKATKVATVVIVVYLCFWVAPNMLFNGGTLVGASANTMGKLGPIIGLGSVLNSSANFFIYALKHKTFEINLLKLFGKQQLQQDVNGLQMNTPLKISNRATGDRVVADLEIHSV